MFQPRDLLASTRAYEHWLRAKTRVIASDLSAKHAAMAAGPFPFLRATYYRWAELWPRVDAEGARAPRVLAVGDLHVDNFGTWRDPEGRLVWGINDFDECALLPFANDLVRLATSALLAIRDGGLMLRPKRAVRAICDGYRESLAAGGGGFVLEERHAWLRDIVRRTDPAAFWRRLQSARAVRAAPPRVARLLHAALPSGTRDVRIVHRRSGLGSLGRPRFAAVGTWRGGLVSREIKAILPSAAQRDVTQAAHGRRMAQLMTNPSRVADPHHRIVGGWVLRRLSPYSSRIVLDAQTGGDDRLMFAMGWETANVHLAGAGNMPRLRRAAARAAFAAIFPAARAMARIVVAEQRAWAERR